MRSNRMIALATAISVTCAPIASVQAQNVIPDIFGAIANNGVSNTRDDGIYNQNQNHRGPSTGAVVVTAACAGIGVILGKTIFGRNSTAGQIMGGLLGGAFCFAMLSKRDNEALKRRSQELMSRQEASTENFRAPDSGHTVVIETQAEQLQREKQTFSYNEGVAKPVADSIVRPRPTWCWQIA